MTTSGHPPKQLLQLLDAANFQLLCPHFATVEMVRKSALDGGGAALRYVYFPNNLSQLLIYPGANMMELTRAGRDFALRFKGVRNGGGSFGNDGASTQRFPVCTAGRRL